MTKRKASKWPFVRLSFSAHLLHACASSYDPAGWAHLTSLGGCMCNCGIAFHKKGHTDPETTRTVDHRWPCTVRSLVSYVTCLSPQKERVVHDSALVVLYAASVHHSDRPPATGYPSSKGDGVDSRPNHTHAPATPTDVCKSIVKTAGRRARDTVIGRSSLS